MLPTQKTVLSGCLLLMLTACGGGGSFSNDDQDDTHSGSPSSGSGSNNGSGGNGNGGNSGTGGGGSDAIPIPEPIDDGRFVTVETSGEGGDFFPSVETASDDRADACSNRFNAYYFETSQARIYGDPDLPTSDYRQVAALVEQGVDEALSKMDITLDQFQAYRPAYAPDIAQAVLSLLVRIHNGAFEGLSLDDIAVTFTTPNDWDTLDEAGVTRVLTEFWNAASDEVQQSLVQALLNHPLTQSALASLSPERNQLPAQLVVCMNTDINRTVYGTVYGINMAPPSLVSVQKDTPASVVHAVIHTVQLNLSAPETGATLADRWFYEGQATMLAGQEQADDHHSHNPVNVVSEQDESDEFGDDGRLPYAHYARAYDYLNDHNDQASLMQIWLAMRAQQPSDDVDSDGLSHPRFHSAFDGQELQAGDGETLSLRRYREDYHELLDQ